MNDIVEYYFFLREKLSPEAAREELLSTIQLYLMENEYSIDGISAEGLSDLIKNEMK